MKVNSVRTYSPAILVLLLSASTLLGQNIITTVAGGGAFSFPRTPIAATDAPLGRVQSIATDAAGNVYITDNFNRLVLKATPGGTLAVLAGNGTYGLGGDGPAASLPLVAVWGIAADAAGNAYFLEGDGYDGGSRVRRVSLDGSMTTVVGVGVNGFAGDGGPATQAYINRAQGLAFDARGNLYIADSGNNRIRTVTPQGIISTVAGNGQCCFTGDNLPATSTALNSPYGVFVDAAGVIYIADTFNDRIRRVGADGVITTIAGTTRGYAGDGGPATQAMLNWPAAVAVDTAGYTYIADMFNHSVRLVLPDGTIRTLAGTGAQDFSGDGGPATAAALRIPTSIAVIAPGNLYIADSGNARVRRITTAGLPLDPRGGLSLIGTFAGNNNFGFSGEGVPATQAALQGPTRVALDAGGNLYIADTTNNRVRKVAPNGVITTFAGAGAPGYAGDGGPATRALLNLPTGVAVDAAGNVYISQAVRVRKVDASGIITTFAGSGLSPSQGAGDGGPATQAAFNSIYDLDFDRFGNLYIADPLAGSIRKVTPGGIITTVATSLLFPMAVTAGPDGALYVPTQALSYARRDGGITRIAPDGTRTLAVPQLIRPGKPAVDASGAIYFTDTACYDTVPTGCANVVTKRVGGANTVIAGTGEAAYGGDGGPATAAALNQPLAVKLDALGNLYVVDTGNNRIRRIFLNPASGIPEPAMTMHLAPGFYIAEVTLGEGELEGYWGMEALAPRGTLAGGFNLGGAIQERRLPPGFGAFYLPSAQLVSLQLNAQVLPGWDASKAGVGIRILDAQRRPVGVERFGVNAVEFQQQLDAGFYIVEVRGGDSGPRATFQLGLNSVAFAGGVDAGGFVAAGLTGFGAFFIPEEQDVTIRVLGRPSYGTDGAGALRLTLRDANRVPLRSVP